MIATPGTWLAALGRITARTFVIPIDEDQLFPVRDCAPEHQLIKDSELRVVEDTLGHLALFGIAPAYMPQIDRHLGDLLATEVCAARRQRRRWVTLPPTRFLWPLSTTGLPELRRERPSRSRPM